MAPMMAARQGLADALVCPVTAHDCPGFGLTYRPDRQQLFSVESNGLLGRAVMDAHRQPDPGAGGPGQLLVGHSMGCLSVAAEVVRKPQGISGVVLVAPAITVPVLLGTSWGASLARAVLAVLGGIASWVVGQLIGACEVGTLVERSYR